MYVDRLFEKLSDADKANLQSYSLKPDILILWTNFRSFHDRISRRLHATCHLFKSSSRYPTWMKEMLLCIVTRKKTNLYLNTDTVYQSHTAILKKKNFHLGWYN